MAFWTESSLEPKRQFRFKVQFGTNNSKTGKTLKTTAERNSDIYLCQSAERPTYTIKGDAAVHFLDKQYNFPGKITWNPIKIKFVDAVVGEQNDFNQASGVNVALRSYKYLLDAGWVVQGANGVAGGGNYAPTNIGTDGFFSTINKKDAHTFVRVDVLGPEGNIFETWTLKNAFITNVALTGMDYAQDGILTAEYSFTYDWAECTVNGFGDTNSGTPI